MEITGYLHTGYPASLGEFGRPVHLSGSGRDSRGLKEEKP